MLRFLTIDAKGQRLLESGILTDVRITADARANALVVSAPAESMELIEALIRQLDQLPAAEAQIKVFTIVNGDATSLADMLQDAVRHAADGRPAGAGSWRWRRSARRRRRELAGAAAVRRRHADQQHHRLGLDGRPERGRGDPAAAGRQRRAAPQEHGLPPEERPGHRRGQRDQPVPPQRAAGAAAHARA